MNKLKIFLIVLLFASCIADIYSTISNPNFTALESNPAYLFLGSIWAVFIFKVLLMSFLSYMVWVRQKVPISRFFYIYIVITLIAAQFIVAYHNVQTKQIMVDIINKDTNMNYTVSTVPAEEIEVRVPEKTVSAKVYIEYVSTSMLMPIIIAMLSFAIYQRFEDEMQRTQ